MSFIQSRLSFVFAAVLTILLLCTSNANAQIELYLTTINGRIVDHITNEPITYAHVVNPRDHSGTTTDKNGYFSLEILTEDTLRIRSVGYVNTTFILETYPPEPLYIIRLNPVQILIDEVVVEGENALQKRLGLPDADMPDVPMELRGSSFNDKPKAWAAFTNPLAYADYFSGREKNKRKTIDAMKNSEEWAQFAKYQNLNAIERLTKLTGDDADDFMMYCNSLNRLPYWASQGMIELQIMEFFAAWKEEKKNETKTQKK